MNFVILVLLYFLFVRFILEKFELKFGTSFNIILFFSIFHIVYTLMIPIELSFLDFTRFGLVEESKLITFIIWSFLGYFGFILPFFFVKRNFYDSLKIKFLPKNSLKNFNYLFLFILIIAIIFFRNEIILSSTYEGNVLSSTNSFYKYFIDITIFLISFYIAVNSFNKKWLKSIIALSFLIFWALFSSDKNPILLGSLSFLVGFGQSQIRKKYSFKILLLFLLVIPTSALLFNSYRSGNLNVFSLTKSLYSNSDPRGPFRSIISVEEELVSGSLVNKYGSSYITSFFIWVPKFIWKNRPDDLAVSFAKANISNYEKGKGLGYSPIAESVLNFGYLGPFFHYLFNCLFVLVILRFFISLRIRNDTLLFLIIIIVSYLVLMPRVAFNLPAYIIRYIIPIMLIIPIRKIYLK